MNDMMDVQLAGEQTDLYHEKRVRLMKVVRCITGWDLKTCHKFIVDGGRVMVTRDTAKTLGAVMGLVGMSVVGVRTESEVFS